MREIPKERRAAKAKLDLTQDIARTCPASPEAELITFPTSTKLFFHLVNINQARPSARPSKEGEVRTGGNYCHRLSNHTC